MELLFIASGLLVGGYLIMVIGDYLKELDNKIANRIFSFVLIGGFIAVVIWMLSSGGDGCANQYYGSDCMDPWLKT